MTNDDIADVIDALDELLDAERAAVLNGDLDEVGRLLARKESLIADLDTQQDADRQALEAMNQKIRRNQLLLEQAMEGIRSVTDRLATLRRVSRSLETYDENGERKTVDMGGQSAVEKRA
ncbi:flagellar biosynthesis protein FlgN [uncultured Roseobacter sp.]|uniref:flagellar biosynthesis protein FlgN n=1 Tax=uncultured Roseobacter sp. TaxID=114847 RepID=UPI00261483E7|nr:flagellar biosynthesis protein FlgN [uncultured Roseobacter sp.]